MKPQTRIWLVALLVAGWAVPAMRVSHFWTGAWRTYHEEQSLNAWNDVAYGTWLAGAYLVCLALPVVMLLFRRMSAYLGVALVAACLLVAADVIRRHPEEVVVLFPSMHPLRPVCWTGLASFVIGLLYFLEGPGSQQGASPNGGPAESFGNSGAGGGPPSVS